MKKRISIIVAIGQNNEIGLNNELLWHLSDDLKRFKKITTGHTIVMGERTFESLPNGALPNRRNMIITDKPGKTIPGCTMAYSIEDAISKMDDEKENFIIGGGSIYRQFLSYASRLYLTRVHAEFKADTFFPELNMEEWIVLEEEHHEKDERNEYSNTFYLLERK